ncbi:protein FAM32A [Anopheles maculipalpis]|uniref:protein FAM32A n=1 Tax=Anopheles maculipalpis TaxID=1496333 RepID=UPI0021598D37|nr:protein FAM32A [Anopheles maculipalpis]
MSDEYQHVSKSKLKLKNDSDAKKKHKKKDKKKDKEKIMRAVLEDPDQGAKDRKRQQQQQDAQAGSTSVAGGRTLTKAEESFKKMQEKMQNKRIVEKAQMTHKQRVELFNMHLDSLTEHFDIPKVSWTK